MGMGGGRMGRACLCVVAISRWERCGDGLKKEVVEDVEVGLEIKLCLLR